jgi:spore maturation protein CgeB
VSTAAEIAAAVPAPTSSDVFDPFRTGRRFRIVLVCLHHDYGDGKRGLSYEWTAFRDPLWRLGCEVLEVPMDDIHRRWGQAGVADTIAEICARHDPDIVFFDPFEYEWRPDDVGALRDRYGIPIVAWFSDDHWRFEGFTRQFLPYISVALTTSRAALQSYTDHGFHRALLTQWGVNHHVYRPLPLEHDIEASFVGQPHSDRAALVATLRRAGMTVVTRGQGWPEGRASLAQAIEISNRSRVCLNFGSASVGSTPQVKGRDFEIPAMGRPMVTVHSTEIGTYFTEQEIVTYASADDLIDKVRWLLSDGARREAIGAAGRQRVLRDHTAEKRLGGVISELAARGWLVRSESPGKVPEP